MKIAKIVSSNSHIDYVARVIDSLDVNDPPSPHEYGFGEFVGIDLGDARIVGIVYDSQIVNPEYASYGPRLSPKPDLGSFSPDFLNEQGVLLGVLLLGALGTDAPSHGVPMRVVPPGNDVTTLSTDEVMRFHRSGDGSIQIRYYSQIIANAGTLALPLLAAIIKRLADGCDDADRQRLQVLHRSMAWQSTFGGMRL